MLLLPVHPTAGNCQVGRCCFRSPSCRISPSALANASCLASARARRKQAEHLRGNAKAPYLTASQRATLLREAEAAERQADWWLDATKPH